MKSLAKKALLISLVTRLREAGSWSGETHIQKSVYASQELLDIPFEFDFVLYKHGPFSFDLREELLSMRADGLLKEVAQPYPYGPTLESGPLAQTLSSEFPKTLEKYGSRLEFVAKRLGSCDVAELERITTALYVTRTIGQEDARTRAKALSVLKPHIELEEALKAVKEVDDLLKDARNL